MANVADIGIRLFLVDTATAPLSNINIMLGMVGRQAIYASGALRAVGGAGLGLSGGMLVGLGAVVGLGAALIWAVKEAAAFETMMSRISINVQGASGPALVRIKDDLIRIADASIYTDTQIGLGIAELGVLQFTAAQVTDKNGLLIQSMVNLAAATGVEPVKAAELLGHTMLMFGLSADQATHAADVLDAAFKGGIPNVDQLIQAFNQVGGKAHDLGFSLEETTLALDLLGQAGLSGSQAGSALRYMLSALVDPTNKAANELQHLGFITLSTNGTLKTLMSQLLATGDTAAKKAVDGFNGTQASLKALYNEGEALHLIPLKEDFMTWAVNSKIFGNAMFDANGRVRPLHDVLTTLFGDLKHMPVQEAVAALQEIFNVKGGQAAAILKDLVGKWDALQAKQRDTSSAVDAKKATDNLTGSWDKFRTSLSNVGRELGEKVSPQLKTLLDNLNNLIAPLTTDVSWGDRLKDMLQKLADSAKKSHEAFAGNSDAIRKQTDAQHNALLAAMAWRMGITEHLNPALDNMTLSVDQSAKGIQTKFGYMTYQTLALIESWGVNLNDKTKTTMQLWDELQAAGVAKNYVVVRDGMGNVVAIMSTDTARLRQLAIDAGKGIAKGINDGIPPTHNAAFRLANDLTTTVAPVVPALAQTGLTAGQKYAAGLEAAHQRTMQAGFRLANAASTSTSINLFAYGEEAGNSFASGIESTYQAVANAADQIAAAIYNPLRHTSPPKMGPLSTDDEWMPNMVNMWAKQIHEHIPTIAKAAQGLAASIHLNVNQPMSSTLSNQGGSAWGSGYGGNQTINLVVDGRVLTAIVLTNWTGQLQLNRAGMTFR